MTIPAIAPKNVPPWTAERWTSVMVADRVREAAETLRVLPDYRPAKRYRGAWPDIVQNPHEAYGYTPLDGKPPVPSAAAISRMDEVLIEWMRLLEANDVKILWSWALGVPARAVAGRLRLHRTTVHRRRIGAMRKLAIKLNAKRVGVRQADLPDP